MIGYISDRIWPLLWRIAGGHTAVYRRTNGRIGHKHRGSPPMLLLDHVGARSGTRRTSPLLYVPDGDGYAVIASKGGYPRHPAWYHNVLANPDTTIQVGSRHLDVRARVAGPQERERLWPAAVRSYAPYTTYQQRAGREIPIVILEPRT